jgi:glyoxylase-like metal-dependent hydrolase (beta-lactamase superfamily II)
MKSLVGLRVAFASLALGSAWTAFTQQGGGLQPPPPLALVKVADDLYSIEGSGGNVAVYLTDEGAIVIDDKFERNSDEILANVKKITDKPVRYVLNTHHHGDHSGGNAKMLAAGYEVLLHKNARANMVNGKMPGIPRRWCWAGKKSGRDTLAAAIPMATRWCSFPGGGPFIPET